MTDDPDDVLDDVLDALETVLDDTSDPVATAPEVTRRLDRDRERRRVLEDLRTLERAGEAASKKVGANARVWWPTAETAATSPTASSTPPARTPSREHDVNRLSGRGRGHPSGDLRELANAVDLPRGVDDVELVDERRDAFLAVLEYLREHGHAQRSDFFDDVYPDHPAGYESPASWWKNAMQPALADAADRDDRLEKAGSRSPWEWRA